MTTPSTFEDAAAARDVSVLICTFNRADRLDETLATLAGHACRTISRGK